MRYKLSHFNMKVRDDAGGSLWLNTATARSLLLAPTDIRRIQDWIESPSALEQALEMDDVPGDEARSTVPGDEAPATASDRAPTATADTASRLARTLVEQGFLVETGREEVREVLDRLARDRTDAAHLSLTIALTSDCDLACPYCIVTTTRGEGPMPRAVQDALLRWWERQLAGRRSCSIEWMVGEPLLYPRTILELGAALVERARFAGVDVSSHSMLSNGTQLTREVAEQLRDLGLTRVQVTLDGGAEAHERCRPSVDGSSSFERIIANLKAAAPLLDLTVRMNISSQNVGDYPALLGRLAAEGLSDRVSVYPARVYEPEVKACGGYSHCTVPPEAFGKVATDFQIEAMDRGFQPEALPGAARGGYCGAYTRSYYVVGADGTLYRCPARIGQKTGATGSIFDFAPTPVMEENQAWYDRLGPTRAKGCFTCKVLPLCLGGCPEESVVSGQLKDECSPWRFKLKGRMLIEHEWRKAMEESI